jgi:hypothetical protein
VNTIKAIYYVENSSPHHQYVLDVCDDEDERLEVPYDQFDEVLYKIFLQEVISEKYPMPDSDVVFIIDGSRNNDILAQLWAD